MITAEVAREIIGGARRVSVDLGLTVSDVCIEGDLITLRCNATTIGDATIEVERGSSTNATIGWQESDTRWHYNFGITTTGLTADDVTIAPSGFTNLITTVAGSGQDLRLDSDTNQIQFTASDLLLNQTTTFFYSEANNRLNRPVIQSTTGNTSGLRIQAPNATNSAVAVSSVFNTNDADNGKFINIRADGSATPISIRTGDFVAVSFTDAVEKVLRFESHMQ